MNNILISINDNQKAKVLIDFLRNLSFVKIEELNENKPQKRNTDLFSIAGIWADRNLTANELRQSAWIRE